MEEEFILTMNRETALIIKQACEFYARVIFGQLDEVVTLTFNAWPEKYKTEDLYSMRVCAEASLRQTKSYLHPELHPDSYYGVGHNVIADTAWNVVQVIRHDISWHDHPEGGWTINFDKPRSWSGTPLPSLKIVKSNSSETSAAQGEKKIGCIIVGDGK